MISRSEARELMKKSLSEERKIQIQDQLDSAITGAAKLGLEILVLGQDMRFTAAEEEFVEWVLKPKGFGVNFIGPTRTITW